MDKYITATAIRSLREKRGITQKELAQQLMVSDKAVSKWETGAGYPDITLLEPLAAALQTSIAELLSGLTVENENTAANMLNSRFYSCPICKNTVHAMGEAVVVCHGLTLPPLEAEPLDNHHALKASYLEGEVFVQTDHRMNKLHHVVFLAAVSPDRVQIARLYPEGPAQARFLPSGVQDLYLLCNRDGLFKVSLKDTLRVKSGVSPNASLKAKEHCKKGEVVKNSASSNAKNKKRRATLREEYKNRRPDMGVVCWKIGEHRWIGLSRNISATYNSTLFQLEMGSYPNKCLQKAYLADPAKAKWQVLKLLDYENPQEDHSEDLELLLMEAQDEYPDAFKLSLRKFC